MVMPQAYQDTKSHQTRQGKDRAISIQKGMVIISSHPGMQKWSTSHKRLMISKLNILINPCTKNNKLLGIVEAMIGSSRIEF